MNRLSNIFLKKYKRGKGFTLVELIVVLVIVAILAAIAVPTFLTFIDLGREKSYMTNAQKALAATQTGLSDLYADASSSFSPVKRNNIKSIVFPDGDNDSSSFTVWTQKKLWDGKTAAVKDNIGSYTIVTALYEESGIFFAYNGSEWIKCSSQSDALGKLSLSGKEENVIYVWPYQRDYAYLGDDTPIDYTIDEDEEAVVKIVTLKLDSTKLDKVFYAKDGRYDNSGKESIDVIFWKDDSGIQSYWYTDSDNKDKFKVNDYYTYWITSIQGVVINDLKWYEEGTDYPCSSKNDVQSYIFSTQNAQKERFVFVAQIETDEVEQAEFATISKSLFKGMFNSRTTEVTQIEFENKPDDAVKVDDGTSTGSIYAWRNGTEVCWCTDAKKARMPADCSSFFSGNANVEKFNFTGFDVTQISTVNGMFKDAAGLKEVEFSTGFNANVLTDTGDMFSGCTNFTTADFTNFYTGELTNVKDMFNGCSKISSVVLTQYFMTGSVTDYSGMFKNCSSAEVIDISGLDISSSDDLNLESMFEGCANLKNIPIDSLTIKPSNLKNTFKDCVLLENLDLSGWNTSNLTSLEGTFSGCTALRVIKMTGWDMSRITSLKQTFKGLTALQIIENDTWNLALCEDMSETFAGCSALTSLNTANIKTSAKLRSTQGTFLDCSSLTDIDVSNMNTVSVSDMSSMFKNCSSLTQISGLDKMNTSSAASMSYMFAYTDSIDTLYLRSFDTARVSNFEGMFFGTANINSLTTINASRKFVVNDAAKDQEMFKNNTNLAGVNGSNVTTFDAANVKGDYAYINYLKRKPGYFTGWTVDIKKDNFKNAVKNTVVDEVIHVPTDDYSLEEVKNIANVKKIDDGKNRTCEAYAWNETENGRSVIKWWSNADMTYLPADCSSFFNTNDYSNLRSFSFVGFETDKITNMNNMFSGKTNLVNIEFGEEFDAYNITSMSNTFNGCTALTKLEMPDWETAHLQLLNLTFAGCSKLQTVDMSNWDMTHVTTVEKMFQKDVELTSIDMGTNGWYFENLTTLRSIFEECKKLDQDFGGLRTSDRLTGMPWMFKNCESITQLDLRGIDTTNLKSMGDAFYNCKSLQSINFEGWHPTIEYVSDTSLIPYASGKGLKRTFCGCESLTQLDLTGFKLKENATLQNEKDIFVQQDNNNAGGTFEGCKELTTIYVTADLEIKYYTTDSRMFKGCNKLEGYQGTKYAEVTVDKDKSVYAKIDGGATSPGYYSIKQ